MNGLSKEKRKYIEEKSMELAKLKMSKFSTLGLSKAQQQERKNNDSTKNSQKKQISQQYYNITPSKARSMSYREDNHSHYSSQIKQINDLSEAEHKSVMLKSNWMIPQEEKPQGDDDVKVSPFVKYHPAILEMKVKSQDKRGYLLQEHQRLKRTERQYLENLKDSRQFSLNNTTNQFTSNLSKLNRTFNSMNTSISDRRKLSGSAKRQQNTQNSQLNYSQQIKGYTVPIKFSETFDDCLNQLQENLKQQSQVIEEENRISRLLEKSQKKNNPNYINIQIQNEMSSTQPMNITTPSPNLITPSNPQNIKQATLSDDESVCSTDKHKQKLNELLCFSLQNLEFNDNINNYGQNFGKYPKFYKYLTSKNAKAQEERDHVNLKIYHQQLLKKKELQTSQSQKQSPNLSPLSKKKGIFSQDYKTFGESIHLDEIPTISQFLQLQQVEVKVNQKELIEAQKKMAAQQFNQKSNPISPQKIKSEDQKIKFNLSQDKKMFSFNSSDINSIVKKGLSQDYSKQNSLLQSLEGSQFHKPANQVLQKKNTIRENEEKSQKFITAFSSKYPYILKKLKQIYKEEKTTKPFTKNYDEVFLSIYDSLSRANDSALDNHNKKNK